MTTVMEPPELVDDAQADAQDYDPDAPYGRRANGQPYKKPPETRAKLAAALAGARAQKGSSAPPRGKPSTGTAKTSKGSSVDYRPGVERICGLAAMGFGMAARVTGSDPFALDGITISLWAPEIANTVHEQAMQHPAVAELLDRILLAGEWGGIAALVFGLGAQIAANHKAIPTNDAMGILSPEGLMGAYAAKMGVPAPSAPSS